MTLPYYVRVGEAEVHLKEDEVLVHLEQFEEKMDRLEHPRGPADGHLAHYRHEEPVEREAGITVQEVEVTTVGDLHP